MNGKLPPPPEDVEEGEVEEVGNMGTPPGDVLVVEEEAFTMDSAQRLIGQIMAWNGEIAQSAGQYAAGNEEHDL
ncbi:hypothetical protein AB205_0101930, partial [Aquarana catesbeiana]